MRDQPTPRRKRVVIVGGGFAGLYAARTLAHQKVDVTLIDRMNHHTFQPLLYQVAAGLLAPEQIATPLRHVLRKAQNVEVLLDEVVGFDLGRRRVRLAQGELVYDTLIVAAGARHSYFGHDEWADDAPGLKTLEDAIEIRRRMLSAFESAERESIVSGAHEPLNFAVVGGGPTGIELAGMIAEISRRVVPQEFRSIDTTKARVMLFEASARLLATYPEDLSASARAQLEETGVEVFTGSRVTAVEPERIQVGEEWIPVRATLWATGVAASPLGKALGVETDRSGRVPVGPDLSLVSRPDVFVVGDMASVADADGKVVPGLGAAATQMGICSARNVLRDLRGEEREPFAYRNKGMMATIGKRRAVALIGKTRITGFPAFLLWGAVHVYLLIGFRSRLDVMRAWARVSLTGKINGALIAGRQKAFPRLGGPDVPRTSWRGER